MHCDDKLPLNPSTLLTGVSEICIFIHTMLSVTFTLNLPWVSRISSLVIWISLQPSKTQDCPGPRERQVARGKILKVTRSARKGHWGSLQPTWDRADLSDIKGFQLVVWNKTSWAGEEIRQCQKTKSEYPLDKTLLLQGSSSWKGRSLVLVSLYGSDVRCKANIFPCFPPISLIKPSLF